METKGRYRIEATMAPDGLSLTVYDMMGRPHAVLTAFSRIIAVGGQSAAARAYTYALLPFFAFLEADPVQRAAGRRWDGPPEDVRAAVHAYLARHPAGRDFFLAALHRFYRVQRDAGAYRHADPLAEPLGAVPAPADPGGATDEHLARRLSSSPTRTCTPASSSPVGGPAGGCASAASHGSRSRPARAWKRC